MRTPLTREQFDAAELQTRRQIAARMQVFDPEELRLLEYFIERSFRLGRTAAYFRSFRHLGTATQTFSHAHEALRRLVESKVVAPLPLTTRRWHWYGFNLNFGDWPNEQKRPKEFWEEPALPFEPELDEMLRETFVEFSAGNQTTIATSVTDRDRDAGSAPVPHADKDRPQINSAAGSALPPDSKTESPPAQHKPENWKENLERFKKAADENRLEEFAAANPECTSPGYASVPPGGTKAYPAHECTPGGYSGNANNDAAKGHAVPPGGTYIASSVTVQRAELAIFAAVPLQGTESYNEKVALAWGYLQKIDLTGGLKVKRFYDQWKRMAEKCPDWILRIAPNLIERQVELRGAVEKPLALLAHIARKEGKMR